MGKNKNSRGSYEIDDINNTIKHKMGKRGHYDRVNEDYYIGISANSNTLKSVLILEKDYQVDFNHQNSLAKVLGFAGAKYTKGFHESENVVNILGINSILINIDIIAGSNINGTTKNTIYSFFPNLSQAITFPAYPSIQASEKPLEGEDTQFIGEVAEKYLRKFATKGEADTTYGLYDRKGNFYIGNKPIVIIDNNIVVDNEEYEGTPGLWELILSKNPDDSIYTNYDYDS